MGIVNKPDLAFAFRRPFAEQVAFFRGKLGNLVPTATWRDLWKSQHDRAFMVAGAAKADLLADLAGAVDKAIAEGETLAQFRKRFKQIVTDRGWHGWTGEGTKGGVAWRTRVIYETNLLTSYSAGRLAQLKAGGYKYWMYRHSDSVRHPRPHHQALNGVVRPADDAFWQTHYPPNGWGCRCRAVGVDGPASARRLGGDMDKPLPDGWDAIDPKTGEPVGIDKGWGYMPGGTADMRRFVADKAAKLPPALGEALRADNARMNDQSIRSALSSPAFDDFFRAAQGAPERFAVAALGPAERALLGCKGETLWLSRQSLDEHKARHPEVTADDYRAIPDIVQRGQVWGGHSPRRYLLLWIGGKPYRAAIKTDADGNEAWFLSLVVSGKQKPPKGAVKLR